MTELYIANKATPISYASLLVSSFIVTTDSTAQIHTHYLAESTIDKSLDNVKLKYENNFISGTTNVIRSLARVYKNTGVYGRDAFTSTLIDEWVDFAETFQNTTDNQAIVSMLEKLDTHLILRTFFVGYKLTLADIAIWGTLKSTPRFLGSMKQKTYPYITRWYRYIESLEFVTVSLNAQRDAFKANSGKQTANFEIGLDNAKKGEVITRFPPEPSGYLHIGHAKAALLNDYFAKHYNGKLLIRFDDTNPSKEKQEFQDSILEDLDLLEIKGSSISYTSDYFNELYNYGIAIIKKGLAYADDTEQEQMREERMHGIESKHRNASIEENLARFAMMTEGSEKGQKWCIRAKIDMQEPNKAMRDPVIYRCNLLPHHRTGSKWKVYPTYDFACPIVDSLEGVTHALRTNEYRDRNPQYYWMIKAVDVRPVSIWDFSRLNFVYTFLSKRKLAKLVDTGRVMGWDDPRFPTVRGIRRRGLTVEALRSFIIGLGPSQNVLNMEWDILWTTNKKIIDPIAPRHTCVELENIVKVTVEGITKVEVQEKPKHKKNAAVGMKKTTYSPIIYIDQVDAVSFADNEEVTLMDWGNVFMGTKVMSKDYPQVVESITGKLHLEGDFQKTDKKVNWISAERSAIHPAVLLDYDYLVTKKTFEKTEEPLDFLTEKSEFAKTALVDTNVREYKRGDIIQLERKGYFIVDKACGDKEGSRKRSPEVTDMIRNLAKQYNVEEIEVVELIHIPDGKAASVASKGDKTPVVRELGKKKTKGKLAPVS